MPLISVDATVDDSAPLAVRYIKIGFGISGL
jgi:hypothetical protein